MINRIVLVGRLVKDPELRKTANETSVASFTVAVDNRTRGTDGKKTASFIPVVVWDKQADNVIKYVRKGSLVGVEGRLEQRNYKRNDGTTAYVFEVIADSVQFLEPKGDKENASEPQDIVDESKNIDSVDVVDDDLPW